MAARTITVDSGAEVLDRGSGDTAQVLLKFTDPVNSGALSDEVIQMPGAGIKVENWGKIKWAYDLEDALLVPGTYQTKLSDAQGLLRSLFFGPDSFYPDVLKTPEMTVKLNGVTDWIGNVAEDSASYDTGEQLLSVSGDPNALVLNQKQLFELDGSTPINEFGYTNPSMVQFTQILQDIFELVSPTVSVEILQDWVLAGNRWDPNDNARLEDIVFTELMHFVAPLFFEPSYGLVTMGDVLKKLAIDWCCFTGLIHKDKAFFHKLFHYSEDNLQSFNSNTVLNRTLRYRYGLIDYVQVDNPSSYSYYRGTNTHLEGRSIVRQAMPNFWESASPGWGGFVAVSNIDANVNRSSADDGFYTVYAAYDPELLGGVSGGIWPSGYLTAEFWYHFRNNIQRCRVDKIEQTGVGYDFLKNIVDDGRRYQIIEMEKDIEARLTDIDAIYLGED